MMLNRADMNRINTVIFDMDGTVLDTLDDLAASVNYVLQKYGMPARSKKEYRLYVYEVSGRDTLLVAHYPVCYALNPENIVDVRHFEVKAGDVTITVSPEQSFLIETREVDGKKYIIIPADGGAELNGFAVKV